MKKMILLCFLSGLLNAQTSIPGGSVYGTWTLGGSPYLVQNAIMIPNDSTLTIQPGVQVIFQGSNRFLILGRLLAIGTATDSIRFTCANTSTGWLGIHFDNTTNNNDTSKLFFCTLDHAINNSNSWSAIYFNNFSKGVISNCRVSYSQYSGSGLGAAILCNSNAPLIRYNYICNNNCFGITSGGLIEHNTVAGNVGSGIMGFSNARILNNNVTHNNGGGLYCAGSPVTASHNIIDSNGSTSTAVGWGSGIWVGSGDVVRIDRNIITNNLGSTAGGIFGQWADSMYITHNIICNNRSTANGGGILCCKYLNVNNNLIANNTALHGGGIYSIGFFNQTNFVNNTIVNNNAHKGGGMFFTSSSSNTVTIKNSIIWGNTADSSGSQVYIDTQTSKPDFSYCDIQGGSAAFGTTTNVFFLGTYTNSFNQDPQFVNPTAGSGIAFNALTGADWTLLNTSPCLNTGGSGSYPATDLNENTRVYGAAIDIGAYEYQGPASVDQFQHSATCMVFPNPAKNAFTVSSQGQGRKQICLFDLSGKLVLTQEFNGSTQVNISELSEGVYMLVVKDNNGMHYEKVAIVK